MSVYRTIGPLVLCGPYMIHFITVKDLVENNIYSSCLLRWYNIAHIALFSSPEPKAYKVSL